MRLSNEAYSSADLKTTSGFRPLSQELSVQIIQTIQEHERDLLLLTPTLVKELKDPKKVYSATPGSYSITDSALIALTEASALLLRYPRLMNLTPQFAPLYRLLRTCELASSFRRGGEILSIGSGDTVFEALAHFIKPPNDETIRSLLLYQPESGLVRGDTINGLEFIDGHMTVIDPNAPSIETFNRVKESFGLKKERFNIYHQKLEEILPTIPDNFFDFVFLCRAEPKIFKDANSDKFDLIMDRLITILKLTSWIGLSVGYGQTIEVQTTRSKIISYVEPRRKRLIQDMQSLIDRKGFNSITRIPKRDRSFFDMDKNPKHLPAFFSEEDSQFLFSGGDFFNAGFVMGQKNQP